MLAVPSDDEERVVDAHAQTDHGAQDQRELRDVEHGGQHADTRGTYEDAEQGGRDRKPHRDDGAECDEQHDDRDTHTDELAARRVLRERCKRTGELDVDVAGTSTVGDGHRVVELRGGELVERIGDVDVRGVPVGADRRRLRRERIRDCGHVTSARKLGPGLLDDRRVGGVVEASVVGVEHDAGGLATLAREPVVQDVGRVLRLGARHASAVVELATDAALQGDDRNGGHEPDPEHPERMPGAATTEAVQECAHGTSSWNRARVLRTLRRIR